MPLFLICKMWIVIPTLGLVVRIHIYISTENSAWPIVSCLGLGGWVVVLFTEMRELGESFGVNRKARTLLRV